MQVAEIGSVKKRLHKRRLLTLVLVNRNLASFHPIQDKIDKRPRGYVNIRLRPS